MPLLGMEQAAACLLIGLASAQTTPSATAPEATLADRVVSVVGDTIITLSELELEQTLMIHDPSSVPAFNQKDPLQRLEDFRILRALAGEVPLYVPDRLALDDRMARFRDTWPGEKAYLEFLERQGLEEQEVRSLMRSRMMAEAYVDRNVAQALQAEVDSSSAQWQERYQSAYQAWMVERRTDAGIRRIPLRRPQEIR